MKKLLTELSHVVLACLDGGLQASPVLKELLEEATVTGQRPAVQGEEQWLAWEPQ